MKFVDHKKQEINAEILKYELAVAFWYQTSARRRKAGNVLQNINKTITLLILLYQF
jgi:hypothetical protein